MKKIEAIIRTSKFEDVYDALAEIGIPFMSTYDVKGFGLEHGSSQVYRGTAYHVGFIPRTKVEIIVTDDQVDTVVSIILKVANTGKVGDGKIFIMDLEEVIRIRTGEIGELAL
ncbi:MULTISPECIES: P-II family nitrogen regulator [Rufibacter]|uniref:Nitrogen regulatory protein P-II 1 n=1 Tax=Rufibacter quisquiliarum TaxID=1549639 RepID=A0A839G8Y8_9BACT|nr:MULTISPECIES: P-II family nitrogen regulator [Rufibacter]MBA9075452.1 nitrogen regulatory protein P-II 1 [Rufibacter quisquiliarum]